MMDGNEGDILNDVILESREHLVNIEPDLLALERDQKKVSEEVINRIFRAVHSIKGGFGFFGKTNITKLSHSMETVLTRLRKKELLPTTKLIDVLLQGVDKVRALLDDIHYSDSIPIENELKILEPFLEGQAPTEEETVMAEQTVIANEASSLDNLTQKYPDINSARFNDLKEKRFKIYEVVVKVNDLIKKDLNPVKLLENWKPIAEVVSKPGNFEKVKDIKGLDKEIAYNFILASILDSDLFPSAVDMPKEQVVLIPYENTGNELQNSQEIADSGKDHEKIPPSQKTDSQVATDTLRVKVSLLNSLVNLAGELVLGRNQMIQKLQSKIFEGKDFEKWTVNIFKSLEKIDASCSGNSGKDLRAVQADITIVKESIQKLLGLRLTDIHGINPLIQNIDRVTSEIQENIMQTRMQPIATVFKKFPRIIRDLSKNMGKEAELILTGEEVELDKSIIEMLSDPLTHLVRNSIDHGIEMPNVRLGKGKSSKGMVCLSAYHEGGKVIIEISDDGAGINLPKVVQKAIEKGLVTSEDAAKMTDREKRMIVFEAGFSTADKITDISGRGVGMDVVRTNIEHLGGTIEIESEMGKGSRFIMKLPLTLAIIPSLLVSAEGYRYAIPQVGIEELVRIRSREIKDKIKKVQGAEVLRLRNQLLPLIRLSSILRMEPTFIHPQTGEKIPDKRARWSDRRDEAKEALKNDKREKSDRRESTANAIKLAVLKVGSSRYGLVVDEISNSEEIVVKPLSNYLKTCKLYSGCTILGNGTVAMILDPTSLAQVAELRFDVFEKASMEEKAKIESQQKKIEKQEILLFNNAGEEVFGVAISKISRIEKIEAKGVNHVGTKEFLKYENRSIRLFRLENHLSISSPKEDSQFLYVLLPKGLKQQVGIIIHNVIDVISTEVVLEERSVKGAGLLGSAIVQEKMTLILDLISFLQNADPNMSQD